MRRRLTALLAMVMMLVMMLAASPAAFAGPKSENSCGASNPNIEHPPNKENKEASGEFDDCGFRNNPNFVPPDNQE